MSTDRLAPAHQESGVRSHESVVATWYRTLGGDIRILRETGARISVHPTTPTATRSNRRLAKMSTYRLAPAHQESGAWNQESVVAAWYRTLGGDIRGLQRPCIQSRGARRSQNRRLFDSPQNVNLSVGAGRTLI